MQNALMRSKRIKPELVAEEVIRKGEDQDGFVIEIIPPKGRGVRTTLLRCKGDFLLAYDGELVSGTEGDRREQKKDSTFRYFFIYMGKELCVDSTKEVDSGLQLGRLVNHGRGKEENCKMKCIEVDKKPYLCLFAIRDREPGEELLYNYGVSNLPWENVNIKDAATSESVTTPDPGNITSNPVSMETTTKLSAASSLLSSTSLQDTQTQQNAILRPKIFKYRETSKQPCSTGQVGQISEAVFKSGADETVSKLQDIDCTRQTKPDQSQTPNVSGGQPTLLHARPIAVVEASRHDNIDVDDEYISHNSIDSDDESIGHDAIDQEDEVVYSSGTSYKPSDESSESEDEDMSDVCLTDIETNEPFVKKRTVNLGKQHGNNDVRTDEPPAKKRTMISKPEMSKTKTVEAGINRSAGNAEGTEDVQAWKKTCFKNVYVETYKSKDGKRNYSKTAYCFYCNEKFVSRISKHLLALHRTETKVKEILSLEVKSKERKEALQTLLFEGNYKHNVKVLQKGEGSLIVYRRPAGPAHAYDYLPCLYCKGFFHCKLL